MKVLLDTNVLLDIVLDRTPHNTHSIALFELIDSREIEGCISATTVTDLYYVAAKERGQKVAKDFIVNLVDLVEVLGSTKQSSDKQYCLILKILKMLFSMKQLC